MKLNIPISFLIKKQTAAFEEDEWEEKFIAFASVKAIYENNLSELEGVNFGNIIMREIYLITTRYRPDILLPMRFKIKSQMFEIKKIINIQEEDKILNIVATKLK